MHYTCGVWAGGTFQRQQKKFLQPTCSECFNLKDTGFGGKRGGNIEGTPQNSFSTIKNIFFNEKTGKYHYRGCYLLQVTPAFISWQISHNWFSVCKNHTQFLLTCLGDIFYITLIAINTTRIILVQVGNYLYHT